jgi:prepilin-type N-terminal cleavage/methylation domain-containing protein
MDTARGFTLIELMVTIAIMVLLGLLAVPSFMRMVDSARAASVAHQFPDDVAWARNQAVTSQHLVTIDITAGKCAWTTKVDGTAVSAHTNDGTTASNDGIACSWGSAPSSGVLSFNPQGFVTDGSTGNPVAPTLTVTAAQGQTWNIQVLNSGVTILNSNTAS